MTQTIVGINTWVAHRDTRVFGQDANSFNPDRWLTAESERLSMMNRYYMPVRLPRLKRLIISLTKDHFSSDSAHETVSADTSQCLRCQS